MITLTVNPYKVGPPVTGCNFYGRMDLLFKVRQCLCSSNVVVLQGQRRIGKSSFLQRLPNFLNCETVGIVNGAPLLPVIFDIQRYIQDTLPQFQEHLAKTIAKAVEISVPSLSEWQSNSTLFRDVWLPQVFERLGSLRLVIIVDEFDNLCEQKDNRATCALVSFLGSLVAGERRLKWVVTVGRDIGKLPIEYDPIVSQATKFHISFLSLEETHQLIFKPASGKLTYEPTAVERIYELTNGQPHLTQALCSEVFERVVFDEEREIATVEDVETVIPQTLKAYQGAIASIARVPILEERVMAAVAQLTAEGKTASRDEIISLLVKNRVQLQRDELTVTLDSLLKWKLLVGDAQAHHVAIELVRIWITKNISLEPSREQELDIHYALAQNRYEFAQKACLAGKYDWAIKDYKEALEHIPNHCEALRGLAEAYRLSGDVAGRATTLQKLYLHERNVIRELTEALEEYAEQCEKQGEFSVAVEQYETLIKLQNCDRCQQGLVRSRMREFQRLLDKAEENLDLEKTKQYTEDKLQELVKLQSNIVNVKQNLDQGLAVVTNLEQAETLKNNFKKLEHQEWIILKRIQILEAKLQGEWKEVNRLLLEAENAGFQLNPWKKKALRKWVYFKKFFYYIEKGSFPVILIIMCIVLIWEKVKAVDINVELLEIIVFIIYIIWTEKDKDKKIQAIKINLTA